MAVWERLSEEELFFILRCERFSDIVTVFNARRQITIEEWQQDARNHYHADYDTNFISQSIFSSLNDATSYPIMTFLAIIGIFAIKFFALTFLTACFSVLTLAIGAIFFVATHQEFRDSRHKSEKFLDFATIKIQCAEELIKRQKNTLREMRIDPDAQPDNMDRLIQHPPFTYQNKSIIQKLKPALGVGALTGTMLFGTYYLGATAIISAYGATGAAAAMTGPIGLAVALAAGLLLAIYSGYRQYQSRVATERIDKQQTHAAREFNHKRDECYQLRNLIHEHCPHIQRGARSHSDTDLLHKKDLVPVTSEQRNFLLRRQNFYRRNRNAKPGAGDPIIPSLPNNNRSHLRPH